MRRFTFLCCAYVVVIPSIIKAIVTSKKYRRAPKEYHIFQFLIFHYGIFYVEMNIPSYNITFTLSSIRFNISINYYIFYILYISLLLYKYLNKY